MVEYWRIRLKNQDQDCTRDAWERNQVGIWYGAWSATEFDAINDQSRSNQEIAASLNELPVQQSLITSGFWLSALAGRDVATVRRFFDKVTEGDWAVIYLEKDQCLGLARMTGAVNSDVDHHLNINGEVFKYRTIFDKKIFALSDLPDAFRLLPAQGRGNVHGFNIMNDHVSLLGRFHDANEIVSFIKEMPFDKQLNLMSASAWESFCLSWLILERNFLPTGLSIGRTLKAIDIVGRNRMTGNRIMAQCKKNPDKVTIEEAFLEVLTADDEGYYFAFGGAEAPPSGFSINIVDGSNARKWAETDNGKLFQRLFLGKK